MALGSLVAGLDVDAVGAPLGMPLPRMCRRRVEWPSPPTNFGRHLIGLPLTLTRSRYAVYHAPSYVAPVWGAVPVVLSVHDISYAARPEWYPYRRDPLRRWFYRHSALRARLVLVPSTFTADELRRVYGMPSGRIRVVPLAASSTFIDLAPPPSEERERVLLHVGDLHARRDLGVAVAVLRHLVDGPASPWRLVLVGRDRGAAAPMWQAARAAGVADRVQHLDGVQEADLRGWYARAWCLLYPSRYEGFGLPVAEAMAAGLPVVAADAASVPEVLGEAGVLFPPGDVAAALAAVRRLDGTDAYAAAQALGTTRTRALTWAATAQLTYDALQEASRG
jgi:glycosyltransferase involved in cell wall biosynthesis